MIKPTCVIVDDEPIAISIVEGYLEKLSVLDIKGTFTAPLEAATFLQKMEVDILFLDIEMPGFSGISMLKTMTKKPLTVLTTAYGNYAIDGFDLHVVDYLLKPIPFERFVVAVNKCLDALPKGASNNVDTLVIKVDKEYRKIRISCIHFLESYGNYVKIHTETDVWIVHLSLRSLETRLENNGFLRVHKSFLVNESFIEGMFGNTLVTRKREIPIGEFYRSSIRDYFENHL